MILISCTKHPGYTGTTGPFECLACQYIYDVKRKAEARAQLGVKVGEAWEAWKVENAIECTD